MSKQGFDQERYDVVKREGLHDPRAHYVCLRIDPYGRDPKYIQACRDTILESFVPKIRDAHPEYASDLEAFIELMNEQAFSFPANASPTDLPAAGDIYLKQGQGFQQITAVTIDPHSNEFVVHFRAADGPSNAYSFSTAFAEFTEEVIADGQRVKVWQKADPSTRELLAPPIPQVIDPSTDDGPIEEQAVPESVDDEDVASIVADEVNAAYPDATYDESTEDIYG